MDSDHREKRHYGKSGSELGPEIWVRFQRVENDSVRHFLFIFSLLRKKKSKQRRRGSVVAQCGWLGGAGGMQPETRVGGGLPRSCEVMPRLRDRLRAEQFPWASLLKSPLAAPCAWVITNSLTQDLRVRLDAGRRGRRMAESVWRQAVGTWSMVSCPGNGKMLRYRALGGHEQRGR